MSQSVEKAFFHGFPGVISMSVFRGAYKIFHEIQLATRRLRFTSRIVELFTEVKRKIFISVNFTPGFYIFK